MIWMNKFMIKRFQLISVNRFRARAFFSLFFIYRPYWSECVALSISEMCRVIVLNMFCLLVGKMVHLFVQMLLFGSVCVVSCAYETSWARGPAIYLRWALFQEEKNVRINNINRVILFAFTAILLLYLFKISPQKKKQFNCCYVIVLHFFLLFYFRMKETKQYINAIYFITKH